MKRCFLQMSALAAMAALPSLAEAQFPPPPPPPASNQVQDRWPSTEPAQKQQPAQMQQPAPAARPAPPAKQARPAADDDDAPKPAPKPRVAASPGNVVACNGVFARDSTHLKLAVKYDSRNIAFGDVDGPEGSKIKATVLYPNEPKRRLEVIWNDDAARTDMSLIVINGQSQWVAPKGLKLGTAIAALEKANGKPFKLSGFGADGSASVTGWEGGAFTSLPGGCKMGVRLTANGSAPTEARAAVAGDKQLLSNNPSLRALKPTVAEILIGY